MWLDVRGGAGTSIAGGKWGEGISAFYIVQICGF